MATATDLVLMDFMGMWTERNVVISDIAIIPKNKNVGNYSFHGSSRKR